MLCLNYLFFSQGIFIYMLEVVLSSNITCLWKYYINILEEINTQIKDMKTICPNFGGRASIIILDI